MSHGMQRLCDLPISQRPPTPWHRIPLAILFGILFNLGCLMINGTQVLFLLPLRILPFKWTRSLYNDGIRYTKAAFGCLLSMAILLSLGLRI